jgi:ABC-2 type transport system permease protein
LRSTTAQLSFKTGEGVFGLKKIGAILMKELRIYFTTPLAYVVLSAFCVITSYVFLRLLSEFMQTVEWTSQVQPEALSHLNFNDYVLIPLFGNVAVFLVFVVPFITMRLVAEERRLKTMELLLVCPLRPVHIVMGKYLAALSTIVLLLLLVLIYPALVGLYAYVGNVAWATVGTGLLGLFLLGACFCAIGLFLSSLTSSQTTAAFLTWSVLTLLWMIGWSAGSYTGATREVLQAIGAVNHMDAFVRGVIDVKDLVYYISLSLFALFLCLRSVETWRWR